MKALSFEDQEKFDRNKIEDLIISCLREILAEIYEETQGQVDSLTAETRLIGRGAAVDSMGLVTLIVNIEQMLNDHDEVAVTIADERALSQEKSPFRTVGSLTEYVLTLLEERQGR